MWGWRLKMGLCEVEDVIMRCWRCYCVRLKMQLCEIEGVIVCDWRYDCVWLKVWLCVIEDAIVWGLSSDCVRIGRKLLCEAEEVVVFVCKYLNHIIIVVHTNISPYPEQCSFTSIFTLANINLSHWWMGKNYLRRGKWYHRIIWGGGYNIIRLSVLCVI